MVDPNIIRAQIDMLIAQCPELADDDQLRSDMVEGNTDAFEFLSMAARRIIEYKAIADGTAIYIKELCERKERIERRVEAFRSAILKVLQAANLQKAELPEATLSVSKGRERLVIPDRDSVPQIFCRATYEPDATMIKDAIANGQSIYFAEVVQGEPTLRMGIK